MSTQAISEMFRLFWFAGKGTAHDCEYQSLFAGAACVVQVGSWLRRSARTLLATG